MRNNSIIIESLNILGIDCRRVFGSSWDFVVSQPIITELNRDYFIFKYIAIVGAFIKTELIRFTASCSLAASIFLAVLARLDGKSHTKTRSGRVFQSIAQYNSLDGRIIPVLLCLLRTSLAA